MVFDNENICGENVLGCFSLDIICFSKLAVSLKLHSQKTVHFLEQIISTNISMPVAIYIWEMYPRDDVRKTYIILRIL